MSQRQKVVWRNARATLICLALLAGSGAWAQIGASVLTGNVVDAATKAPVADVVVTATSPSLQGEQVVVTDATGLYRIPQLPPGIYTLRFEKESYRPFSRTGIDVVPDRTLRLNVELLPETAGATEISVVGSPPVIDVGSSTQGSNVNQDFIRNIAVARPGGLAGANRSFESLALSAPQAYGDVYGVAINGAQSPEQLYLIDGLSTNSPAYGVNGTPLTSEFIDEVNVITGGYMPEYGRTTGGAVSAVTKTGGNEFHGSVFGTWTPGSLTGWSHPVATINRTINSNVSLSNIGDVGATLGGYIIKDKLWFFAGVQYSATRYSYTRSFNILQGGVENLIPNSEQRRFGDEHSWNYIGKLTYQITQDHRLSASVTGTPTSGGGGASFPLRSILEARGIVTASGYAGGTFNALSPAQTVDSMDVSGEYNGSFVDKKLLVDLKGGWHHQLNSSLPSDGSRFNVGDGTAAQLGTLAATPGVRSRSNLTNITLLDASLPASVYNACGTTTAGNSLCGVSNYFYGGQGYMDEYKLDSYQFRAVVTYLLNALGHHVLKAGFDYQAANYDITQAYSGGAFFRTLGQGGPGAGTTPNVYDYRRYGRLTDVDVINDEPVVHRTVKSQIAGGFVQDSWSILDKVTVNLGLRYDALAMQGSDGLNRLVLNDQWSPRIGAVWDPTQQGRAKIYANYGIYYENIPLDMANRSLSAEVQPRGAHHCNPLGGRAACDANTIPDVFVAGPGQLWAVTGAPYPSAIDPNVKSPSNEEVVAGAEYEVLPNARLAASYTHRNYKRALEDMSNTDGQTYFIGNPGEGIADSFPKAKRVYDAVTVSFNKTFSDLWLAQVSYTWSRLTGNYDGLWSPNYQQQLDPNITANFDLKTLLLNGDGVLSADITHFIKVYLAKEFVITPVFSISVGGSFNANSGGPVDALGAHPIYGDGLAYLLVRGSAGRLPWVTSLDGKVNFNYRFTKDLVLTAAVEAFNIFNSQRPTQIDSRYTQDSVGPIIGATPGTIPAKYGGTCAQGTTDPANCTQGNGNLPKPYVYPDGNRGLVVLPAANQTPVVAQVNPAWGQANAYQPVRQFRFSLRVTF